MALSLRSRRTFPIPLGEEPPSSGLYLQTNTALLSGNYLSIGERSQLHLIATIIFNICGPGAGGRQVMDADEHHVLHAVEMLVEGSIDVTRFQ